MGAFFRGLLNLITLPLRALIAAPGKLFSGSRRLAQISLPARVAVVAFLFLLICVTVTLVVFVHSRDRAFVWAKLTVTFVAIVTALVILIPLVLYKVLQLWLEGEIAEFDDIERAWKAGLAELQRHGLDLHETPLFLVLGTAGAAQEKTLFNAAKLELSIRDFPPGQEALRWYASPTGIFVVLSGIGSLSSLARLSAEAEKAEKARPRPAPQRVAAPAIPRGAFAGKSPTSTIQFDSVAPLFPDEENTPISRETAPTGMPLPSSSPLAAARTMQISDDMRARIMDAVAGRQAQDRPVMVAMNEEQAAEQERRVRFLGRLIRRSRQLLCPINGVLTLLPFWLMQRGDSEAKQLQWAVGRDLNALVDCLQIRCSVNALVVGMEEESGFRELVRRVGRERAALNRIGKGFELWHQPGGEALKAVAEHACGLVEAWIYKLFCAPEGLNKPGNAKLYMLLCKLRLHVLGRLKSILAEGYGFDPARGQDSEGLFFGGCYFAGLGDTEERQAFAKGVLDKMPEQQGYLAWTPAALGEEDRYRLLGQFVLVVDTLLLLGVAAVFAYHYGLIFK